MELDFQQVVVRVSHLHQAEGGTVRRYLNSKDQLAVWRITGAAETRDLVDDDQITIRRVAYDIEREVTALFEAQYPAAAWLADTLCKGAYVPTAE